MTRRQRELKKRNEEIRKLFKTMILEDISTQYNISIQSIYRILKT